MRTVDAQNLIDNAAGFCGLDRVNLAAEEFQDLRNFLNNRLRYAWGFRPWSDLERTQQRFFRPAYAALTAYTAGMERYDAATREYYQALRSTTGHAPTIDGEENSAYWAVCADSYGADDWVTGTAYAVGDQVRNPLTDLFYQCHTAHTAGATFDATKFGALTPFDRYVAYEQTGEDAIEDVLRVTDLDPRVRADARTVKSWNSDNGVQVYEDLPFVWIELRVRVPELQGDAWDETLTYAADRQVYYATATVRGNFYDCLSTTSAGESPASAPNKWSQVELPRRLQAFLENGAASDWLMGNDGEKAAATYGNLAENFLHAEAMRHDNNAQQRMEVQTRY